MIVLVSAGILITFFYMLKIGMYRYYWNSCPPFEKEERRSFTGISVVVAFRNEEENLPLLLESLNRQIYPETMREFILVDDHSHDRSLEIAESFSRSHHGFHCLSSEKNETGKKAAVLKGVRHSAFNLIALTDADCTMGSSWLDSLSAVFTQQNADMIIGLLDMGAGSGLFHRFQQVEFLSLVGSGAAAAAGHRPVYCNSANLAFRKELILAYADPLTMAVPSGDDTLFMLRVKEEKSRRIVMLKSADAIVTTGGATGIRQFLNQRSRWASKARHYTDRDILYTAGLVAGISLVLILSSLALAIGKSAWLFPALLIAKSIVDYLFLRDFLGFYGKKISPVLLLLFETGYPVYIVISAVMGVFNLYTWKGRRFTGEGV